MSKNANQTVSGHADRLLVVLREMKQVVVAFSGGVDSTVVAKGAALALGTNAIAVTGRSASLAEGEAESAAHLAALIGIRHQFVDTKEFSDPRYLENDGTRCYHCKSNLYDTLRGRVDLVGSAVICSGANLDDLGDYRPGLEAARERGVRHPLQEAGLNKEAVRELARFWELPNWNKPATPCLSSRIAVGVDVTPERTRQIDLAEQFLRGQGFSILRVRYHAGDVARIEVSVADFSRLCEPVLRRRVVEYLKEIGFKFVALDLEEFRSGGLNVLVPEEIRMATTSSAPAL